jgi:putative membrane protein
MGGKTLKELRKRPLFRFTIRVLVIWAIQSLALIIMAWLLDSVQIDTVGTAIVAAAVIGLLNALLWPVLSYIVLPFAVLTLGIASLVMNGVIVWLATQFVPGFYVDGLWAATILALGLTAINTILSSLLTIDDDSSWQRNVLKRRVQRQKQVVETDEPGFLFLELDGLAKPVLERAVREGHMPTLARWLETGSHRLVGWETDMSSQTSASQAGLLHGNNSNIPAFRWYDRAAKEIVASSSPGFVAGLEKTLSDGNGLLADEGASRGNLFSGDAPYVMNTASTILDRSRFHTADFQSYFLDPYNFSRTLLLAIWDVILEMWQFRKARRNNVYPISDKKKRGGIYPLMRVFMTVVMRDLNVNTLVGDIFAGVPAAYATFVGYDEVAHHSGVESEDAFDILHKLDKQLARLERVTGQAPRPYHLVVLSDHGQTGGATFKQRYHMTLEDLVRQLAREKFRVQGDVDVHEDWSYVNSMLTEAVQYDRGAVAKPLGRVLKGRSQEGQVALGPEGAEATDTTAGEEEEWESGSTIVVLASGNLGLVYGTQAPERATLEEIEEFYPGLLEGLAQHEGVGFLLVHSAAHGPVVIAAEGRNYLAEERVEGEDPLAGFGPNASRHLKRNDGFKDAPDLYVSSFYDPEKNEGAAFEEQIGFHGGMGGTQTQPFLLYPAGLPLDNEPLIGAAAVHQVLKGWVSNETGGGSS